MGNTQTNGFQKIPKDYLKNLRKKSGKRHKPLLETHRERLSSTGLEKEHIGDGPSKELTPESVTAFIVGNPDFLDEFVNSQISQDKINDWITHQTAGSMMALETVLEEDGVQPDQDPLISVSDISQNKQAPPEKHREETIKADPEYDRKAREKMNLKMKLWEANREALLYPRRHKREELTDLIERQSTFDVVELDSHFFAYTEVPSDDLNHVFVRMVHNLMGKHAYPMFELTYFLSTLRANYNNVVYHNYHHALSHAQSMYWILKKNPGVFTELEMKALMIASISHDVNHPGLDDYFMNKVYSGFQFLYDSPLLESHHAQTCFLILQDVRCNVFCGLNPKDYMIVLDNIKHAILSTNINSYRLQVERLRQMMESGTNLQNPTTRKAIKSLMMMACDLCSTWKRWEEHKGIVWTVYKEFFNQSDLEGRLGIPSKSNRMRAAADSIPKHQVTFMESIALPVFKLLSDVFPVLRAINKASRDNMECWKTY